MADYMDLIMDAVDKVAGKVKDYTDGKSARDIYEDGVEKVSGLGKRALLSLDITGAKEQLKETFTEVGRLCYQKNKDNPDPDYKEMFERIDALCDEIMQKQDTIEAIKYGETGKDIEVEITEFGEVVDYYENN